MKGFTLVELMGVIVILAVLSVIVVVGIDKSLKEGKENLYENQIDMIELSTKNWLSDNPNNKPIDEPLVITLQTLVDEGYLTENINNPKTGSNFDLSIEIKITRVSNSFDIEVLD